MTFLFETEKIKALSEMLSLNFNPLQRAVKQVSSHVFSIKINNHTGIALGHSLACDLEIEQSLDFLSGTTLCYWWIDEAQKDLASRLKKKGFLYGMSIELMKANLLPIKKAAFAHDIKIVRAKTLEEKDLAIGIISCCFDTPKKDKQEWIDYLESNLGEAHCFIYLAYWQNTPVAVALALHQNSQLILDEVCVLPDFRNKGLGFAISCHALKEGARLGLKKALLGASDAGGLIYQKLGFKKEGICCCYDFPKANLGASLIRRLHQ